MKQLRVVLFFLSFFLLVFGVRALFLLRFPMYLDEGIYLSWAALFSQSRDYGYVSLNDGKTPLFMWLTSGMSQWFSSTLLAGRTLSVLAGAITAVAWSINTQLLFGKRERTAYMLLALIVPYAFFVERMAFVDSLVTAFCSLAFLSWLMVRKSLELSARAALFTASAWAITSGLFLGIGYMTKTSARLFVVTQCLVAVLWVGEYLLRKQWLKASMVLGATAVMYAVYHEVVSYMHVGAARFWGGIASKELELTYSYSEVLQTVTTRPLSYLNSIRIVSEYFWVYLAGILILAVVTALLAVAKRKNWGDSTARYLGILWLVVYVGAAIGASILVARVISSRYFYPITPAIVSLASVALAYYWHHTRKIFQVLARGLVIVTAGVSIWMVLTPVTFPYAGNEQAFTTGDISALGMIELPQYLKDTQQPVFVTGIWGVKDGGVLYLKEQGYQAVGIDKPLEKSELGQGSCTSPNVVFAGECYRVNSSVVAAAESTPVFLYLTQRTDRGDELKLAPGFKLITEFQRPSELKTYLFEYSRPAQ